MSDLIFNIRFGVRHFQVTKGGEVSWQINDFHYEFPPKKWFQIYTFFGKSF